METICSNSILTDTAFKKICDSVPVVDPLREAFLQRLRTFHPLNWAGKPIDPPTCANYGWELEEEDVLKCSKCNQYLCVTLPPLKDLKAYNEACGKLRAKLVLAHSRFCIFNTNHHPENLAMLERLPSKQLLADLKEYVKSHCWDISLSLFRMDEITKVFKWLKEENDFSDSHWSSVVLFMTGWSFVKDDQYILLCGFCNRKWSVAAYISRDDSKADNCDTSQCPKEKNQDLTVDPVFQHHRWCAWRNEIQGWQSRLDQFLKLAECAKESRPPRILKRCASLTEDMKAVRKLLGGTPLARNTLDCYHEHSL